MQKLNALALGYAGAILSALGMLVLSILANSGLYTKASEHMQDWHEFYSLSVSGTISGMIEAAVWSFVILWVFGWLYNKFSTFK